MTATEHDSDKSQVGPDYGLVANRGNEYLLDRETQRKTNYTGIEGFATQDACVTESMGRIYDRTKEHLGVSDSYVIALRRFLLKAVQDFAMGIEPPGLVIDPAMNDLSAVNCTSVTMPLNVSWKEEEQRVYGSWMNPPRL